MNTSDQINFFAKTNFRNQQVPFGIKPDDRRRHMYVIGKTGMGKTTMMENMVIQDIRNGNGVCFIDPHGDSIQKILDYVPQSRVNDVVYFNPADLDHPIAFNILESVESRYKHLVASGLMGVFTKIWASMWSSRMEYILNNTILALLDSPGNTMLGIVRMYVDKKYRKKIVDNIKDPMVKAFWVEEFANYAEKYRTEAVAPIQNKVGQFLSSSIIRNIVGQPKSTIDLRDIMDNNKILLLDLSKGKVGEDNSSLLGAMIITKLQLAALSRVDIPEQERKDFYLYVDEFQNFVTDSFATILSEARKYRLNLTMGHQYIGQLTPENNTKVRDAVFGNVGTMVVFRVGAADAEYLETEFEPAFTPNDIVNLPKYHVVLRLMINGVASDPFTAVTIPVNEEWFVGDGDKVIKVSRERYAKPRDQVEDKIQRWMGVDFHEASAEAHSNETGENSLARNLSNSTKNETTSQVIQKKPAPESQQTKPQIQIASDYLERVNKPQPKSNPGNKPQHSGNQSHQKKNSKSSHKNQKSNDIWSKAQDLQQTKSESLADSFSNAIESAFTPKKPQNQSKSQSKQTDSGATLKPGETYEL
ncbi:MAG TPA: type IV secretion system DNA-binding domain-containing protein [Candidatus Doudnabacteria bacterium]|nr:type IV secretion system DNA-binding domain-containing protein [Candidatus Doudnabacteria bacterium]